MKIRCRGERLKVALGENKIEEIVWIERQKEQMQKE